MFDYRFNGLPNMLTAQMPFMSQNMLTPMPEQTQPIDPMATGSVAPVQQPIQAPQGDMNYFPPAPDANRAPITQQDYQASLSHLQPQGVPSPAPAQSGRSGGFDMGTAAAFLQGLGRGNGVLSAIGGGLGAVEERKQGNQTVNLLMARGVPEAEAQIVARNPQTAIQVLQNLQKGADPKTALELQKLGYEVDAARLKAQSGGSFDPKDRYMTVGKQVFDKTTGKLVDLGDGGVLPEGTEYGVTPVFGLDEGGNTVFAQLGKDGNVKVQKVDGFSPLSPGDKASDTAHGKAIGEARANLPAIEQNATQMLGMIDALSNDPYLDSMVGPISGRLPNLSGDSQRVQARMDQIGGQTFLQAYNMLRGGGVITDIEGQKATEALARLNTAQNPEDYRAALTELRVIVQNGLIKARGMANTKVGTPSQSGGLQSAGGGTVDFSDYFKQ